MEKREQRVQKIIELRKEKVEKQKKKHLGHGLDNSHCTSYDIHHAVSKEEDS